MGLDGDGGGGGGILGVGNPFTGAAKAIEVYGDFAVAYSGVVSADNTETTLIESTTGNYLFVGTWLPQYMVASHTGDDYRFVVYLNNSIVASVIMAAAADRDAFYLQANLIIPAYTQVKIIAQNTTDTTANNVGGILTGRLYR